MWVGGESGPSLRRARFGDAWYPIGSNDKRSLDTLPRLSAVIERLHKVTAQAGRDPDSVSAVYRVKYYDNAVPPVASDSERRLFFCRDAPTIATLALARLPASH